MNTGARVWHSEASTIDTWIFLSGALTVRQHFPGTEVAQLATKVYEQADWAWMTNGGPTLTMGWNPEAGFLKARWTGFSEDIGMYLMAIGSSTHPLAPGVWSAFEPLGGEDPIPQNFVYMQYPPLFIHQYPEAWIDFTRQPGCLCGLLGQLAHRDIRARRRFAKASRRASPITPKSGASPRPMARKATWTGAVLRSIQRTRPIRASTAPSSRAPLAAPSRSRPRNASQTLRAMYQTYGGHDLPEIRIRGCFQSSHRVGKPRCGRHRCGYHADHARKTTAPGSSWPAPSWEIPRFRAP